MKNKRFMKLIALASCVTLMAGCFGKKEEKSGEDPIIPSWVIDEIPSSVHVGDTFDLAEFVHLTNASEFALSIAEASKDLVSVDGTVITVVDEGNIIFTVSVGSELSQTFTISSIRESREFLMNLVDGVGYDYTLAFFDPEQTAGEDTPEDESDDEYDLVFSDAHFHNENYVLFFDFGPMIGEEGDVSGGLLRYADDPDQDVFLYTVGYDESNEYVQLENLVNSSAFDLFNAPLNLDFSSMKYEYDAEYEEEMYVLTGNAAGSFAENYLGYNSEYFKRIEFVGGVDPASGIGYIEIYPYATFEGETFLTGVVELSVDEESVGYELLDEYTRAMPDYWNYFDEEVGLGDFFLSPNSYVRETGGISLSYGWTDANGDPIDTPEDVAGTYFEDFPVGGKTMFTSDTSVWDVEPVIDEESGQIINYNPVSGKMSVTSGEEEPVTTTYNIFSTTSGYFAEEADEGVWDLPSRVFGALCDRENYYRGSIMFAQDMYHTEPGEQEGDPEQVVYDGTYFAFKQGGVTGLLNALFDGDNNLAPVKDTIDLFVSYGYDLYEFFGGELIINPTTGVYELEIYFPWDEDGTQYYSIKVTSVAAEFAETLCSSYETYMIENVIEAE